MEKQWQLSAFKKKKEKKLFFCWRHHMTWCNFLLNVLAIFMVEEFYIYAVVQFFSQEKVYV